MADVAARPALVIINTGNTSTLRRPGFRESILDISMGTPKNLWSSHDWEVSENYSGSDHQYIRFFIRVRLTAPQQIEGLDWNARKLNPVTL